MLTIRYHRQLARSIYIWGVFTPHDFGILIIGLALNMVIFDSNLMIVLLLVGFPAYLAAVRLGRPPGNDIHYFGSLATPRLIRPSRAALRSWHRGSS